jgi:mannosyltransferase
MLPDPVRPSVLALDSRRASWGLAIAAAALGTALSATGSSISSLWGDEVTTSMSARRSWGSLIAMSHHVDAVHSTYYAIMHVWVAVFGISPVALRFPSALAVGAAVAGAVALVRLGGGSMGFATAAALMTAVLPRLTYAGEEARSFALTAAVSTWVIAVAVGTLTGRIRRRVGWWVVAALIVVGAYLFLYTLLLIPVLAVAVVVVRRSRPGHLRLWLTTTAAVALAVLPVVAAGWRERGQISYLETSVTTDPFSLLVAMWFSTTAVAVVDWTLILVAAIAFAVERLRTVPWTDDGASRRRDSVLVPVLLLWALLPTALLVAAQPLFHGFSGRYMTFTAPAVGILVARGACLVAAGTRSLRGGRLVVGSGVVVLVVVAAVATPAYREQRTPYAKNGSDWAEVAAVVRQHARAGDDVLFDETAKLSHRPRLALRGYPTGFVGLHDVALTVPYWRTTTWHDDADTIDQAVAAHRVTAGTVWVVQYTADASHGTEGDAALRRAGYHEVRTWRLHTDAVIEFRRA